MDPPTYEPDRTPTEPILINLCPLPNASSFLVGTLGYGTASVQGEVQIKSITQPTTGETDRPTYDKLVVELIGNETADGVEPITIIDNRVIVWDGHSARSSTSTSTTSNQLPTTSTFSINLTNDLPHCIHRTNSSLEYTLSAILTGPDLSPVIRRTPIHLERNTNPSQQTNNPIPPPLVLSDPITATIQLAKTSFRRSEVVGLVARIEVPSAKAVQHDNIRLRTISAELVRKFTLTGDRPDRPQLSTHGSATSRGKENAERSWIDQPEASSSQPSPLETAPSTEQLDTLLANQPEPAQEMILSRSGKSCRFSPSRPVILKLLLHPPAQFACESITQSTIFHQISFEVRVTIGLVNSHTNRRQERLLSQTVTILPDWPALSAVASDKQREVRAEAAEDEEGRVPTYNESSSDLASSFAATTYIGDMEPPPGWDQEEYDGYEELSAEASSVPPPPPIEEDVSPPSAAEENATAGSSAASLILARVEQLRLAGDLEDPPPPLEPSSVEGVAPAVDDSSPALTPSAPLAPPLPPTFASSSLSPSVVPSGLPPPYAGDGPPSYASTQPSQVLDSAGQGPLYNLRVGE